MQRSTNRSLVPKSTWTIFTLSVGAFIVFLSTVPLQLPPLDSIGLSVDKIAHSFAYFVLAANLGLALSIDWQIEKINHIVLIGVFIFGFVLELIQGYVLVHRTFEAFDLLANTAGTLTYLLMAKTIKKIVVKSRIFIN